MNIVARLTSAAIAATVAFALPASAQTFVGYTNACFYSGGACVPEQTTGAKTDMFGPLTYTNSTFSVDAANGFVGIGSAPAATNTNNLGSFSLPTDVVGSTDFSTQNFLLNVFFTAPAGVTPTSHTFMATLIGTVTGNAGGVFVDFNNTPQMFTYTGGSFSLEVSDVNLNNTVLGQTVAVTGNIRSTVPEPSTYLLMASGLAGMGMMVRRRRNA